MILASVFEPLYEVIGWLLAFLYKLPPHNLGIAIILMTFVVMAVQLPLITKQTRSMIVMQRVQPEIKKIQAKFKDDRQKMNEEMMRFYQENKINPLAGCLPLLLIMPIGFAVFGAFRDPGIQAHVPRQGTFNQLYVDICGGADVPVKDCNQAVKTDPPPAFDFLGTELNVSAQKAVEEGGVVHALPWLALLGVVVFSGWYQVRQTQARQLRQGSPVNKQMQTITRIMPVFFGFISYGLFAATTLYFAVSNLWRIGQQHFVLNKFYEQEHLGKPKALGTPEPEPPAAKANGTEGSKPAGKSGAAAKNPASSAARRKKKRKR